MAKLILLSLDSLSDAELPFCERLPCFHSLSRRSAVFRDIDGVFSSAPYPAHASITTGRAPREHGIYSDTFFRSPDIYRNHSSHIRCDTVYDAVLREGGSVASLFWPSTVQSAIPYNFPAHSLFEHPSLSPDSGSVLYQLSMLSRHYSPLSKGKVDNHDDFTLSCALDTIKRYKPDVLLLRFVELDMIKRRYGLWSLPAMTALSRFDRRLNALLNVAHDYSLLLCGSYSLLPVKRSLNPSHILGEELSRHTRFFCTGGSAFLHVHKQAPRQTAAQAKQKISSYIDKENSGMERFLDSGEMYQAGLENIFAFGVEARRGVCFGRFKMAAHGYSVRHPDYRGFYMVSGKGVSPGLASGNGSVLDIAPTCATLLGLSSWKTEGSCKLLL